MLGVRIQDKRQSGDSGFLDFDLRDILAVIGEPAKQSEWYCYDLCYTAIKSGVFNEFEEARLRLSGDELIQFASEIRQTIDGRLVAKRVTAKKPWLVIIADDSSWFEVWSSKPKIIERIKEHFQAVSDMPTGLNPLTVYPSIENAPF